MSYSSNGNRPKLSEKGLLTPDNCVVALIDHQPQMIFGTSNFDRQGIINNTAALSKAARVFDVPVVLSTVETKAFSVPGMDRGVGNRLPVSDRSAETTIQRQGRHLQWRRS